MREVWWSELSNDGAGVQEGSRHGRPPHPYTGPADRSNSAAKDYVRESAMVGHSHQHINHSKLTQCGVVYVGNLQIKVLDRISHRVQSNSSNRSKKRCLRSVLMSIYRTGDWISRSLIYF